jgi:signal peptidase I
MTDQTKRQPNPSSPATIEVAEESVWIEGAKTIGLALILAFGIRTFVAEARYIPTGSMEPTLQVDDRLVVDKVTYHFRDPARGDIVVFNHTKALKAQGFKDAFIKRIVGLPGDQVEIKNGSVFINNRLLEEPYVHGDETFVNTCPNGPSNPAFLATPQKVPAGHYLVLGDNRHNSLDGRCWGLVASNDLVGRAVFRFWPFNHLGTFPDSGTRNLESK